jgi:hypothetical protein
VGSQGDGVADVPARSQPSVKLRHSIIKRDSRIHVGKSLRALGLESRTRAIIARTREIHQDVDAPES